MDTNNQCQKDISKVFTELRTKLNAKEKELLEQQRAEPSLLAPDVEQIEALVNAISSLHLSTQDGSFIFASDVSSDNLSTTCVYSSGVDSIKSLPTSIWLNKSVQSEPKEEQANNYRLPMISHLFSLPLDAFIASSSNQKKSPVSQSASNQAEVDPPDRLPMVSQLFSMPMSAFRSSSNDQTVNEPVKSKIADIVKPTDNINTKSALTTETPKSIFDVDKIYSKEYWIKKPSSNETESAPMDLDKYIEHTTEKMRRLHMEYIEALEKLKMPSNVVDPSTAIQNMYPKTFDRMKQDMAVNNDANANPPKK